VRSGGRVPTSPQGLAILAKSLCPDDQVALEATGNALAIARRLEPHVARVVVATRDGAAGDHRGKAKIDQTARQYALSVATRARSRGCSPPGCCTAAGYRMRPRGRCVGPSRVAGATAYAYLGLQLAALARLAEPVDHRS
jgi:hypothetical protein